MDTPREKTTVVMQKPQADLYAVDADKKDQEKTTVEEIKVSGEGLRAKLKELMHQGNIRRIIIKNEAGHTLLEIPMMAGVVGGVAGLFLFPEILAIGVIASMFAHLTLVIERHESVSESDRDPD